MPELVIEHHLEYTTKEPISIPEIVDALLGLERIIQRTPDVLETLFPNTKITNVNVLLANLESGSLIEDIIVKFVFGKQEDFDDFIKKVREKCQMDKLKDNKVLLTSIIVSLILTGGYYAVKKSGGDPQKLYQIEANNNTIINIGAGMVEMSPELFKSIIETTIKKDTNLATDAIHIIKPAKKTESAEIIFDNIQDLKVTKNTVSSIPSYLYQEDEDAEHFEDLKDVFLEIRAMDLDRKRQGWAAVVPAYSKERAKLQIDAIINLESLKGKSKLKGDVTLVWGVGEKDSKFLRRIILKEIKEAKE